MYAALILVIIFTGVVLALAVIGGTILMAIKMKQDRFPRGDKHAANDEARMFQEIYQGISKMEKRVEALETILLDRERRDSNYEQI